MGPRKKEREVVAKSTNLSLTQKSEAARRRTNYQGLLYDEHLEPHQNCAHSSVFKLIFAANRNFSQSVEIPYLLILAQKVIFGAKIQSPKKKSTYYSSSNFQNHKINNKNYN